jgi:hypothetical protein
LLEKKRGVPAARKAHGAHSGEKIAQAGWSIDDAGQNDADETWTKEHGGEHHQARKFRYCLAAQEVRRGQSESAGPGDREGQDEVSGNRIVRDEIFIFGWSWNLGRHGSAQYHNIDN